MKLAAIGDIHGKHDMLVDIMAKLFEKTDPENTTYIFLGDYVDGGKQTKQVIIQLMAYEQLLPHTVFLMGNHEDMLLNGIGAWRSICYPHIAERDFYFWYNQGGKATALSYMTHLTDFQKQTANPRDVIDSKHVEWMMNLSAAYETEHFIFVHAGLKPNKSLHETSDPDKIWLRDEFINSPYDWGKKVIFGHTYQRGPLIMQNKIGIDTMQHSRGCITAVILDDKYPEAYEFVHSFTT